MFIRSAVPGDAPRLSEIYRYYVENTAVSFEYAPPGPEEFARRISATLEHYPYLVAEENGVILGYVYAAPLSSRPAYGHCAELSVYVDRACRRRGCGRGLYRAMEARLAEMGIRNLYACIASPDGDDPYLARDSEAFHGKVGFAEAGRFHRCGYKFGRFYDVVWMEKLIGTREDENLPVSRCGSDTGKA